MITRGIIEAVDDSGEQLKYVVRIPVLNGKAGAPGATPTVELKSAIAITTPGITGTFNVGDSVFVGFENNDAGSPVILGHLKGDDEYTSFSGRTLNISDSALLPKNTKIGSISYDMLYGAVRWWRSYSGGVTPGGDSVSFITVPTSTGLFDDNTYDTLVESDANQIIYNSNYYQLGFKDGTTRRYVSDILLDGKNQYIDVSVNNKTWAHSAVLNPVLYSHINDTAMHLQPGDREYWNDKVTCYKDPANTERLVFTKSNLLT